MMSKQAQNFLKIGSFVGALALLGGCASTQELESIRAIAEEAQQDAAAAQRRADDAMSAANQAQQTADQAQRTADSAMSAAQRSQSCCQETNEKLDRMFKKTMYK